MPRTLLLSALALVAGLAFTPPPTPAPSPDDDAARFLVMVTYQDGDDLFRRARVQIRPADGDIESLRAVAFHGPDGWITLERLRASDGMLQARAELPTYERIDAVALLHRSGRTIVMTNPSAEDGGAEEDGKGDGDKGDGDGGDDDGGDDDGGDDDDEGCSTAGCTGIVDPWTCECYDDIRDPWGEEEVQMSGFQISL